MSDLDSLRPWPSVLESIHRDEAWRILRALGDGLAAPPYESAGAASMRALFLANLDRQLPGEGYAELASRTLDRAAEMIDGDSKSVLFGGYVQVAWVFEHLRGWFLDGAIDVGAEVDDQVLEDLRHWSGDFDLIRGFTGLGVYALERYPRGRSREILALVLSLLRAKAEPAECGLRIRTLPEFLPEAQRKVFPNGYWNLGVAHGAPGVLGFLSRLVARVPEFRADGLWLLRGIGDWVLSRVVDGFEYAVPMYDVPKAALEVDLGSRLGWCYGDLGSAVVMFAAATVLQDARLWMTASRLSLLAAKRAESSGVQDACICHGAIGCAIQFARLYQYAGQDDVLQASRRWAGAAVTRFRAGSGLCGFESLVFDESAQCLSFRPNTSFLLGTVGIGLGLLACVGCHPPDWDSLLVSRP